MIAWHKPGTSNRHSQIYACLSSARSGLLVQDGFAAHDGVLAGHASAESTLNLGSQGELVQVVSLLCGGHESLSLQRLVLETLHAVAVVVDLGGSRVAAGQTSSGAVGSGQRRASTDG